jgi:hypothetical protein
MDLEVDWPESQWYLDGWGTARGNIDRKLDGGQRLR